MEYHATRHAPPHLRDDASAIRKPRGPIARQCYARGPSRRAPWLFALALAGLGAACDDPSSAGAGRLGVAGASCLRSPDCEAPLQCIANVCATIDEADASGDADGSEPSHPDTLYTIDGTNPYDDGVDAEIVTSYDASDWEFLSPDTTSTDTRDVGPNDTSPFSDCGELGIAPAWHGTFAGAIDYDITPNPLTPSQGTLPVNGNLSFEIACIESKFIVKGEMDGVATVQDQGDFPFVLKLQGYYDPINKRMQAKMVDGSVSIYDLIVVYFEGDFVGSINADDNFLGTWSGESTGTNQQFITGTATGEGVWGASSL